MELHGEKVCFYERKPQPNFGAILELCKEYIEDIQKESLHMACPFKYVKSSKIMRNAKACEITIYLETHPYAGKGHILCSILYHSSNKTNALAARSSLSALSRAFEHQRKDNDQVGTTEIQTKARFNYLGSFSPQTMAQGQTEVPSVLCSVFRKLASFLQIILRYQCKTIKLTLREDHVPPILKLSGAKEDVETAERRLTPYIQNLNKKVIRIFPSSKENFELVLNYMKENFYGAQELPLASGYVYADKPIHSYVAFHVMLHKDYIHTFADIELEINQRLYR